MVADRVPELKDGTVYSDWKRRVNIWKMATKIEKGKMAATLITHMKGRPEAAAIQLDITKLCDNDGVEKLIQEMDKLYEPDSTQQVFNSLDEFLQYKRPSGTTMEEYCREFTRKVKMLEQRSGKTNMFDDGVLAYFLLQNSSLDKNSMMLIRATVSELKLKNVEAALKKTFGNAYGEENFKSYSSSSLSSSSGSSSGASNTYPLRIPSEPKIKVKEEPATYYQQCVEDDEFSQPDEYYEDTYHQNPEQQEEVFYQHGPPAHFRYRPKTGEGQRPYFRGRDGPGQRPVSHNRFGQRPQGYAPRPQFNPYAMGKFKKKQHTCHTCGQLGHFSKDCEYNMHKISDKNEDPETAQKMTFFKSEFVRNSLSEHWRELLGETANKALIDTGAVSTVCGRAWFENFWKSLSDEERREVRTEECNKTFLFGDRQESVAKVRKKLPVSICGVDILLSTYLVENDIPLLISAESMIKMRLVIDLNNQKVQFMGKSDTYQLTNSGLNFPSRLTTG